MISARVVSRRSNRFHLLAVAAEILDVLVLQDLLCGDEVGALDRILVCHLMVFRVKDSSNGHTDCRFTYASTCFNDTETLVTLEKGVNSESDGINLRLTWFVKWKGVSKNDLGPRL